MESLEKDLVEKLALEHSELAEMVEQHKNMKVQQEEMAKRPYLSPEDDIERKKLQKEKLALKDRIYAFIKAYS